MSPVLSADAELELRAALDQVPQAIRVHEGGGPEDLLASVAVNLSRLPKMQEALGEALILLESLMMVWGDKFAPGTAAQVAAVKQKAFALFPKQSAKLAAGATWGDPNQPGYQACWMGERFPQLTPELEAIQTLYRRFAAHREVSTKELREENERLKAQKEVLRDWMARSVEYMERNPNAHGVRLLQALETEMFNEGIRPSDFGPRIEEVTARAALQAKGHS